MITIRRTYFTSRLPKLSSSLNENISIGKFLRPTTRICPKRNHFLGEHFCRYAVRLKIFSSADNNEQNDTQLLHTRSMESIKQLDLLNVNHDDCGQIKLPSTGEVLSESINKSLSKWKHNAHHEIRSLYKDKDVGDEFIVETVRGINHSLIGWYLQTYGMQNAFAFIQWLGVPLFSSNSQDFMWPQPKSPLLIQDTHETQTKLNQMLNGYEMLEKKLNYKFQNKAYLLRAVSHESFTSNDLTLSHRGLDFVGDAILNYIIARQLFKQYQKFDSNELQRLLTLLCGSSSLSTVSIRNEFHKFLRYTSPELRDNINSFVAFLRLNRFKPVDDLYLLDRRNFIFEVPPIIPDTFEALIGAIYFDSMMDLNTTSNSLLSLMQWDFKTICENKPKTAYDQLFQLDEKAKFSEPVTVDAGKIEVKVTLPKFQNKCFSGFSRDRKLAKWAAAKSAVIQLKSKQNKFIPVKQNELFKHYKETF